MREQNTQQRILVEAQDLIQRFGYFGLSLQDLADRIEIRKPSLYAHYDSKESLGVSLLKDYDKQFKLWAERMQGEAPESKLHEFFLTFERHLTLGKVSPDAALAMDSPRLPESMRLAHVEYLNTELKWLESVVREGQARKHFLSYQSAADLSQMILRQVIGAQVMARLTADISWFHRAVDETTKQIRGQSATVTPLIPTAIAL